MWEIKTINLILNKILKDETIIAIIAKGKYESVELSNLIKNGKKMVIM